MSEAIANTNNSAPSDSTLGSEERIKKINALIVLKKEADMQTLKIEGHLQDLELEYQREVNGAAGSIIRGLDGYLGIRSSTATPLSSSRSRRPNALPGGMREEDRIFTRATLLPSRHSHHREYTATASSADDDFDRERGGTEEEEMEEETMESENDSDYESGSSYKRRQR